MSKRLIMSLLSAAAMSVGGFFVSCGDHTEAQESSAVIVQLPEGCSLVSPRDELGALTAGTPVAKVKPGPNQFVITCGGRMIQVDKTIAPNQHTVAISAEELR